MPNVEISVTQSMAFGGNIVSPVRGISFKLCVCIFTDLYVLEVILGRQIDNMIPNGFFRHPYSYLFPPSSFSIKLLCSP